MNLNDDDIFVYIYVTGVNPSPDQLRSQLCDLQSELQVHVLTLSHRPQQAAVLLAQFAVSVLQFSHGA